MRVSQGFPSDRRRNAGRLQERAHLLGMHLATCHEHAAQPLIHGAPPSFTLSGPLPTSPPHIDRGKPDSRLIVAGQPPLTATNCASCLPLCPGPGVARLTIPELHDLRNQAVRNRSVEWKTEVALLACIGRNRFLQRRVSLHRRVQADVMLEGREIDEDAPALERRNSVADGFGGARRGPGDRGAHASKDRPSLGRAAFDVLVNRDRGLAAAGTSLLFHGRFIRGRIPMPLPLLRDRRHGVVTCRLARAASRCAPIRRSDGRRSPSPCRARWWLRRRTGVPSRTTNRG